MLKIIYFFFLTLAFLVPLDEVSAKDDKALKKQRHEAQKDRQAAKNERSKEINEARKSLREYAQGVMKENQELKKNLDLDYKLKKVDLQADKNAKVAAAEAEYQKKWSALFLRPEGKMNEEALKEIEK